MGHIPEHTINSGATRQDTSSIFLMKKEHEDQSTCAACIWRAKCDHLSAINAELYEALEAFFASSWAALGDAYGETFSVSDDDRSDWAMAVRAFCRDADLARAALAKARGEA